jgi:dTDP-4-dehydrorhamnose 3,5-epimerase
MNVIPTALPEVLILEPKVFGDERGFFFESWNQKVLDGIVGQPLRSCRTTIPAPPRACCAAALPGAPAAGQAGARGAGRVFDVAVDLRRSSPRLGQWVGVELSAENKRQMWVPPGFGHGFLVL